MEIQNSITKQSSEIQTDNKPGSLYAASTFVRLGQEDCGWNSVAIYNVFLNGERW